MRKVHFVFVMLMIALMGLDFAVNFPSESVMNFNPAYMVVNQKWSISYETYFGNKGMDFAVFQPFQDGFAGEIGLYVNEKTSGMTYSIASILGKTSVGASFDLSIEGTSLKLSAGFGAIQRIWENLNLELRVPSVITYVYNNGFTVEPNFEVALSLPFKNWNTAAFVGVKYPWVKTGLWGGISFWGAQIFGQYTYEYNSVMSSATNGQIFDLVAQYSIGAMKFAYIYENRKYSDSHLNKEINGLRFTVEW